MPSRTADWIRGEAVLPFRGSDWMEGTQIGGTGAGLNCPLGPRIGGGAQMGGMGGVAILPFCASDWMERLKWVAGLCCRLGPRIGGGAQMGGKWGGGAVLPVRASDWRRGSNGWKVGRGVSSCRAPD